MTDQPTQAAAAIPEAAFVAGATALHGDCCCESPDEHDEMMEGDHSIAEIVLVHAADAIRADERQRIRQLAEQHRAHYGCYVAINSIQTSGLRSFADLLGGPDD